ncbi:MAG: hypothetical protein JRD92_02810 [Deltaproteobacteria bacterium]|nr:hypothetical protein [Deltaproteobacteria bacterium]MBW1903762.1 hypothetical protein [Deltaproteobacteria bacterium]MBW2378349.1 hypothetical protein [Deltaproteobacteria bacterium]MBW2585860.1 hypothetical protein [Deltaproteobacteria bacterium]MBW2687674.1 hypothetical protein [Deltaproteobacteria bacterium]
MRHLVRVIFVLALGVMGCSEGGDGCIPGSEGCVCNDGQCLAGLQCLSNLCVDPGGSGGSGGVVCTPALGQPVYVNPALGVDDAEHGGGPVDCAFATIEYALTVAHAEIMLAPGDYNLGTTITLGEGQSVICDPAQPATLRGPALPEFITVRMEGNNSAIRDCVIDGDSPSQDSGSCIFVRGETVEITGNTLANCGERPIYVAGGRATITDNLILFAIEVIASSRSVEQS